jgi:hypothetical protein
MGPAVQERDTGLSDARRPLWPGWICCHWIKIRHDEGHGNPPLFAKEVGVRYPLAVASDDLKQKFGGIEGLPTTMLYDREGILRKKVIGLEYTDAFESALRTIL